MSLAENLIADFELESEMTLTLLGAVPEEHLEWRPHEKSMTLGALAGHIAEAPAWMHSMLTDSFDMTEIERGDYKPFVPADQKELLAERAKNAASFRADLEGRDDAFMSIIWTMSAGGHEIISAPRHAAVRSIILRHVSHHRGQLTVYLRMLDIPVPPTYGPTADAGEPS